MKCIWKPQVNPGTALLAITPATGDVRRYKRNVHGKVWMTHAAVMDPTALNDLALSVLRDFLRQPENFPKQPPTEAA